ncbi:carbohydrate ABC transporter permease [Streptomyces phaeochromogenes]|nr:carbohydrate ABC transporter permease [Streptomyces phaeochromogenes]MCX5604233.1 carbohydrate ABC transporter permease [Streptomyces phaeochromogenes]WRZ31816.1 carbohydrate ABC transporter permease [Streptomyces phaeochromogenes]WSJ05850.1 carbohydrate ABC transporter permease [Streptomyces phaeochromogenes]WSS95802.1 carbohydrate ABC transporter permease [Streptomyces phaeochromogenes]WSW15162.1 carbohydrate ABC transporter permease [Streptomyces phaeochromogenes]
MPRPRPAKTEERPTPPPPQRRRKHWTKRGNPVSGLGSVIWLAIVIVPIYAMLSASLTSQDKALTGNPLNPPTSPTLDNYNTVLNSGFGHLLSNTAIVAVAVVAIVLGLSVPIAYVAVRTRNRWSGLAFRLFLLGVAIPAQAVVVPLYLLIAKLNLYDSLLAVILPTAAFAMPVSVLVLVGTLRDVSEDLYEAMALDGASPQRMLFQLAIPLAKGGISTVVIFAALQAWNGFLFPLIFTQSDGPRVLTLGLFNYVSQFGVNIPALLASVVLSGIPIFAVYLVARRALVGGLMGVGGK